MDSAAASHPVGAGWASRLARVTAAVLLFELFTGLAVTFGPFHPAVQWGLILHTVAGVLTLAPLSWYFVRHWNDYAGQALSDVKLLGYAGLLALAVCALSGVAVTWQGLFGIRTTPLWRYVHLISTLLAVAATLPHIGLAWFRRRGTGFALPAAPWLAYAVAATAAGIVAVAGLTLFYSGPSYRNEFPAGYSFAWGRERPFAPSLARTSTNGAFSTV